LYDVTLTVTNREGQNDSEVKRGYVNAYQIVNFRPGIILPPMFTFVSETKVYEHTFTRDGTGNFDTGIPFDTYVCGVRGFVVSN